MFRTAMLRSAASAVRAAARPAAAVQRTSLLAAVAPRVVVVPRVQSLGAVRMYSAAGSLGKEQVEGRIMSLLQGFDKVSCGMPLGSICRGDALGFGSRRREMHKGTGRMRRDARAAAVASSYSCLLEI